MTDFPTFSDLLAFFLITLSITAGIAVMIFVSIGVFALLENGSDAGLNGFTTKLYMRRAKENANA